MVSSSPLLAIIKNRKKIRWFEDRVPGRKIIENIVERINLNWGDDCAKTESEKATDHKISNDTICHRRSLSSRFLLEFH